MHRRLIVATSIAIGVTAAVVPSAAADGSGFGYTDGPNVGAGASDTPTDATPNRRSSGSPQRCQYEHLSAEDQQVFDNVENEDYWTGKGEGEGEWYRKICYDDNGLSFATLIWLPKRVSPEALAQQALNEVPVPQPGINMNPSADKGAVTNVETWLWIDRSQWQPVSASASAGNVTVTTTAAPDHVVYDMGNGDKVTCNGPGTPYEPNRPAADQSTDCSYTYTRSSANQPDGRYVVTATVFYTVAWSATGIAAGGALAPITQSSSVAIRVSEIQALNH